eukprot:Hpha_TRINITY_DN10492_c0_g3::TRINITY_DN10492_c0_g3_i1::g.193227::m.193227
MAALNRALAMRCLPQGSYSTGRADNLFADTPLAYVSTTKPGSYTLSEAGSSSYYSCSHDNNRALDNDELEENVGGTYVEEMQLRALFNKYDVDGSGFLEFDEVKRLYNTFENCGVEYSDADVNRQIKKYALR